MLVDKILEYYGRNPEAYVDLEGKWFAVIVELFVSSFILFPILFAIFALIYLYIKRKKYQNNKKKLIAMMILYPIAGAILGCLILYIIIAITAALAVNSLYGGSI